MSGNHLSSFSLYTRHFFLEFDPTLNQQEVLKLDDENYMALVLLGACYQDFNKEEATKYLKKAIQVSKDDHLLALQGLASCASTNELPSVLLKLLKLTP